MVKKNKYKYPPVLMNYSSNIFANSSPLIFSFSNNTPATACNLSILFDSISLAAAYALSIIDFTSISILAAVSSLKFLVCVQSLPKKTSSWPEPNVIVP